ncbi:TBC1 domain family member 9 [Eumeta japonica]|uniref:TBC1 domain family member 9 n=1 Tax=Eumeta variegata TaxID=151549 RepID=A0A4C1UEE9_EUMVA|nr:TBC1 domain family member 9 [Eumeta japonica]
MPKDEKLVCYYSCRWADVTELSKSNALLFPDSIKVVTRDGEYYFTMFLRKNETFALMQQLANIAMKQLIDDKSGSFNIDKELLTKLSKNVPKKPSFLKRDLDARKQSNLYTLRFRLPQNEKLDGTEECTLWTPYDKKHNWGRLYLSQNFICFDSRDLNLVRLTIPLRSVHQVERADSGGAGSSGDSGQVLITTAHHSSFLFGNIVDREFFVNKISELLAKLPKPYLAFFRGRNFIFLMCGGGQCKAKNKFVGSPPCPTAAILKIGVEMNYSVLSRFDGPGCGSASDRVSELNTSGRTGEGRGNCGAMCGCREAGMKCSAVCFHCSGETCSNVMKLSELINENDFDDEPPTLTPLPSPVLPLVFNSETRSDAEPQPGPSKRLRTE